MPYVTGRFSTAQPWNFRCMNTAYLVLALLSLCATFMALFPGRALGWWVPLWFLISTAANELAVWNLLGHLLLMAAGLVLLDPGVARVQLAMGLLLVSTSGVLVLLKRHLESGRVFERALSAGLGANFESIIPPHRAQHLTRQINATDWLHPLRFQRPGVQRHRDIAYGPAGKRHLMDIYTPVLAGVRRPVLLQIHGGAWLVGHKAEQALPLIHRMATLGWVVVAINYRLAPAASFPDPVVDVKRAIAWLRDNIDHYGGDPDFIAITGGSAGGHLASLAALSPNQPQWQPGFESANTRVQAAMPLYGVYDLSDRAGIRHGTRIDPMIIERLMKTTAADDPELFDAASPICWLEGERPPLFLIQGTHDTLVWVEEARRFVAELAGEQQAPLVYAELPGAQHAFETVHSIRTSHFLNAAALWLEWAYARWQTSPDDG